jgi:hypothetical protein
MEFLMMNQDKIIKQPAKDRGEAIVAWLKDHPLISCNALCALVGYDTSNFMKAFDGDRAIPAKHLDAFEKELKRYGFVPPK